MRQGLNPSAFLALSGCPVLIESLYECIYISIYTQTWRFSLPKNFRSCSCTTCIVYVNLFKDLFFYSPAGLNRKADAKVRSFCISSKFFRKFFFRWPLLKRVTKARLPGSAVSIMSFRRRFLSESGCKSSGFRDNRQIYAQLFSYFFKSFFLNDWLSDVFYNMFSLQVDSMKVHIYHIIYMRARKAYFLFNLKLII